MMRRAYAYQLLDNQQGYLAYLNRAHYELPIKDQVKLAGEITRLEERLEHHKAQDMTDRIDTLLLIIPSTLNDT